MSPQQEEVLAQIKEDAAALLEKKFRKGDQEHGGTLMEIASEDLLDAAIEEAVDQMTYLLALRYQLFGRPK